MVKKDKKYFTIFTDPRLEDYPGIENVEEADSVTIAVSLLVSHVALFNQL